LKRENKSKNYEQIKNYYIQRQLRRFIQIDRKLLEQKKSELLIVPTEEEFTEKCRQNPEKKNIHFLIQDKVDKNLLLWQKSSGPVSSLNEFIVRNDEYSLSIEEGDIFHRNNEKILLISAEPGMGKSLILDHFTQNSTAENFFIKIVLNTCTDALNRMKSQKVANDSIEFVLKSLLNKTEEQEIDRLKLLAQQGKLVLMFDGLDEVNTHKEQVIQLIQALIDDSKYRIKKCLITTRNHLREELEDRFRTFAFDLNNFDDEDQKRFLVEYWQSLNLRQEVCGCGIRGPTSAHKLEPKANLLISKMKSKLSKNINELIGIPLQIKMLADIFIDKDKDDLSTLEITNIASLYLAFIEAKIRIQLEEKSKRVMTLEMEETLERAKEMFYLNHSNLSSSILFDDDHKEKKQELPIIQRLSEKEILQYGIVVAFTANNKKPKFLHQSFAEFFLAKFLLEKIEQNQFEDDQDLEQKIMLEPRYFLVRKFLNDLMEEAKDYPPQKINENDFNKEIEICCHENLINLLRYFIQRNNTDLNDKNEYLVIASTMAGSSISGASVMPKYKMDHDKRGIALVINMRSYDAPNPFELRERVWSEPDVEILKKTLNYLEFQVVLCQNLTKNELEQVMKEQAKLNYDKYDCFLCVVMSHGNDEKIITSDCEEISFDEIMAPIKSCPTLIGKPKLFFFQACRGDNELSRSRSDSGKSCNGKYPHDMAPYSSKEKKLNKKKEHESDLFIFYSTLPGHYAFGTEAEGTCFIKSVCEVFYSAYKNLPNNMSLTQMIIRINEEVKQKAEQMTDHRITFTKELYFMPKNVSAFYFCFLK
jgi:hypothetical protein